MSSAHGTQRIAHLSDVHTLEAHPQKTYADRLRLRYLNGSRTLDAPGRTKKLARALSAASESGADQIVISGDLTEMGTTGEFEAFAETLDDSGIDSERITLVPGNHDAYASETAWTKAMDGPLRAYSSASAGALGKVVDRGSMVFLPLSTARHQSVTRSAGQIGVDVTEALERRIADATMLNRAVVIVQHHPPYARGHRFIEWIDGLMGHASLMDLLRRYPRVHVLHGHLHHFVDRVLGGAAERCRIFGAPAVVEDKEQPRIRLYDVRDGQLEPVPA